MIGTIIASIDTKTWEEDENYNPSEFSEEETKQQIAEDLADQLVEMSRHVFAYVDFDTDDKVEKDKEVERVMDYLWDSIDQDKGLVMSLVASKVNEMSIEELRSLVE
jgi:hypothetical protein